MEYQNLTYNLHYRAGKSYDSLMSKPRLFIYDPKTGLFKMDLVKNKKTVINEGFISSLKGFDKFLLHRIEIGTEIEFRHLVLLFSV